MEFRFDERLAWKQYILEIIGSAMPRVNALKSLAAKSICRRPDWILKLHKAVVNSVWKYGCIAYSGMGQHLWDRLKRIHSQCIKSYTGVPQYVGYETIINHLGLNDIKTELQTFARKRLLAILQFSPLGRAILEKRSETETIYHSPTMTLLTNEEAAAIRETY